ncbi:phosphotransferase, partial [Dermatophilus congolensis]|nr:phosphotransferase [Dermatophilus congolensis]
MINPALTLAALADAALPDARPTRVEHVTEHPGDHYSLAFIEDNTQRRWAIRLPTDPVAAALQDQSLPLLETLRHHLPYATPHPHGFASLRDGRRAMLYPLIPGRTIKFDLLPPGPGLATALGQAIATIHNLNPTLYDTAGLPTYDATDLHRRRICDIDLGASTGLVPTGLLNRWEPLLEDIALWRFPTRPTHGHLEADHILIDFNDPHDASTGHIVAITSWDNATIGDPATDLATVLTHTNRRAAEAIFTAYATTLTEPPDPAIRRRATLLNELRLLGKLLTAKRLNNHHALTHATKALT